jgi:DNA mismatch endonuclease (patch repair protein)
MSRIKGKNTKPELLVRSFLFSRGFRYRLHVKGLPGKPDILLPKYRTAIMVNGCFWHAHSGCRFSIIPKSNTEMWANKLAQNVSNDFKKVSALKELGWTVVTIWECELKGASREKTLINLIKLIQLGQAW